MNVSLERLSKPTGIVTMLFQVRFFYRLLCSRENIFEPLGMTKTSFYLTADLKSDLVRLAYRQEGQLQKWGSRFDLIEQDVTKGM